MTNYPGPGIFTINNGEPYNAKSPPSCFANLPSFSYPIIGGGGDIKINIDDLWKLVEDDSSSVSLADMLKGDQLHQIPLLGNIRKQTIGCSNYIETLYQSNPSPEYKQWLRDNRSFIAENELLEEMKQGLGENGVIFHNYDTKSYLQLFTEALDVTDSIVNGIDYHWKTVARLKGKDITTMKSSVSCKYTSLAYDHVLGQGVPTDVNTLKDNVENYPTRNADKKKLKYTKKIAEMVLKNINHLTAHSARRAELLENIYVLAELMIDGKEVDYLLVLPEKSIIMQVEMKYLHDINFKNTGDVRNKYNDAKKQLINMQDWMNKVHGDVLANWNYVGVVSLPTVSRNSPLLSTFSNDEKDFLLLKGDTILNWFNTICTKVTNYNTSLNHSIQNTNRSYQEFIKRTIGLSGFSHDVRKNTNLSNEEMKKSIVGENATSLQPGCSTVDVFTSRTTALCVNTVRIDDQQEEEKSSLRVLLWSPQQKELIETFPDKVLLQSDFGTGKTLLLKTAAIKSAENQSNQSQVYYVTLSVPNSLFEISTNTSFKHTGVTFLSAVDIYQSCDEATQTKCLKENDYLALLDGMLPREPDAFFFIDELLLSFTHHEDSVNVPTLHQHQLQKMDDIHRCGQCGVLYSDDPTYECHACVYHLCGLCVKDELHIERLLKLFDKARGKIWIALRYVTKNFNERSKIRLNNKVVLPELPIVARCSGNITKCANKMGGTTIAGNPVDTHAGPLPRVTLINDRDDSLLKTMKHIVKTYGNTFIVVKEYYMEKTNKALWENIDDVVRQAVDDVIVHTLNNLGEEAVVRGYVRSPCGVLIGDVNAISGMEATVVVYVTDEWKPNSHKDAMMRTVSLFHCIVVNDIHVFNEMIDAGFEDHPTSKM